MSPPKRAFMPSKQERKPAEAPSSSSASRISNKKGKTDHSPDIKRFSENVTASTRSPFDWNANDLEDYVDKECMDYLIPLVIEKLKEKQASGDLDLALVGNNENPFMHQPVDDENFLFKDHQKKGGKVNDIEDYVPDDWRMTLVYWAMEAAFYYLWEGYADKKPDSATLESEELMTSRILSCAERNFKAILKEELYNKKCCNGSLKFMENQGYPPLFVKKIRKLVQITLVTMMHEGSKNLEGDLLSFMKIYFFSHGLASIYVGSRRHNLYKVTHCPIVIESEDEFKKWCKDAMNLYEKSSQKKKDDKAKQEDKNFEVYFE